jgi:hypothetical protein
MRRSSVLLLAVGCLTTASVAHAQPSPLPPDLIGLDTEEGARLLSEAKAKADFGKLVGTFVTQEQTAFCGIAAAVTVLNAMPLTPPATPVGLQFTQQNFFTPAARSVLPPEEVGRAGTTLAQLGNLIAAHPTKVDLVYASELGLDEMRARLAKNLADPSDFVIVNYQRGELQQEALGHHSPLGAYHAPSDRFLVLDVARYKYVPTWIPAEALHRAMRASDLLSGKSRGFLQISPAKQPKGAIFAAQGRRPTMILGGIIAAAFFVGVGVGVLLGRLRVKRPEERTDTPDQA